MKRAHVLSISPSLLAIPDVVFVFVVMNQLIFMYMHI